MVNYLSKKKLSNNEIKVKLTEYEQANEFYRHHDVMAWQIGAIFITASFLLLVLIIVGIILTFPWDLPHFTTGWFKYLLPFSLITFLLLTIANLFTGITINSFMEKLESYVSKFIFNKFIHFAEIEEYKEELNN